MGVNGERQNENIGWWSASLNGGNCHISHVPKQRKETVKRMWWPGNEFDSGRKVPRLSCFFCINTGQQAKVA